MEEPRIEINYSQGVTVVELLNEEILDEITIDKITESLFSLVSDDEPVRILLSFSRVKRLSSSMLSTLIRLSRRVRDKGGVLKLCGIGAALCEMFAITRVNKIFDIYEDEQSALSSSRTYP